MGWWLVLAVAGSIPYGLPWITATAAFMSTTRAAFALRDNQRTTFDRWAVASLTLSLITVALA